MAITINFRDLPAVSVGLKADHQHNPRFHHLDSVKSRIGNSGSLLNKRQAPASHEPTVLKGFVAQVPSGTPLDNNLAISDSGKIVSVVNTVFRVYDTSGNMLYTRSLAALANQLGTLNRTFDPHVIYDREQNRFILVFLNGSDHTNTNIIVGFSQSGDPAGVWNFYKIPGNISTNEWWSDYPFIGISEKELFITVLLWKDGESGWDSDASDENIWQLSKEDGYAGKALRQKVYHGLSFAGRSFWNIRPVTGAQPYGPDFYLLTNRPKDLSNDSIFLIRITGLLDDSSTKATVTAIKSNKAYGLQPNSPQKGAKRLRTNYCDIHSAYYIHGEIYFAGNTRDPNSGRPGIYAGWIPDPKVPQVFSHIIAYDTLDLNYPSIAYAGGGPGDRSAMIVCLHASPDIFPGTSVILMDRDFEPSEAVRVKEGEGAMNILFSDTLERWGDYTGIQTKYNEPGAVWMAGSFGRTNGQSQTWIAKAVNTDPQIGMEEKASGDAPMLVYPNPSRHFRMELEIKEAGFYSFEILDVRGTLIWKQQQNLQGHKFVADINLDTVKPGIYFIRVMDGSGNKISTQSLVVSD